MNVQVPLTPCFPLRDPLSISEYSNVVTTTEQLNLKVSLLLLLFEFPFEKI